MIAVAHRDGLTLIEVLVALVLLLVGLLGLIGFQTFTIRASTDASIITEVTRIAKAELESQRQIEGTTAADDCRSSPTLGAGYTCTVAREDCVMSLSGGAYSLTCGLVTTNRTGRLVTVTVDGPRDHQVTLSTLYTGVFITTDTGQVIE